MAGVEWRFKKNYLTLLGIGFLFERKVGRTVCGFTMFEIIWEIKHLENIILGDNFATHC